MQTKIGIGAIGVGGRLRGIIKTLLKNHGEFCELRGMSDEATAALDEAREKLEVDVPVFNDYRELLRQPGIDWVLIGSKNYLHRDHCVDAFAAGKHVFCEKPLAITVQQCEDIRQAHHASGKLFATGFVLRHAPLYVTINNLINEGKLGRLVSIEANENLSPDHGGYIMRNWRRFRKMNGSHLLEKCSHDIDLINWMIGSVPSRVASFAGLNIFTPENQDLQQKLKTPEDDKPLYRSWPCWEDIDPFTSEKDVEDNQVTIMEYRNKVRVTFHANCCTAFSQRRMLVCGLEGTLEADLSTGSVQFQRIGRQTKKETIDIGAKGGHGGADTIIVDDLARCMQTGELPKASGEEGFKSAITCLAIDQAMLSGTVVDVEPLWKRFNV